MENEVIIRIAIFVGVFCLVAMAELLSPRRVLTTSKTSRWFSNLGIVILNNIIIRLAFPILPIGLAILAQEKDWGLLRALELPYPVMVVAGIIIFDLIIYIQHVMFHSLPVLWRLHMMHHADLDYDLTTGLRFHPIEIIISLGIKLSVIAIFGQPVLAVILFEIILNATATFNHGNIYIPGRVDKLLRLFLVTPDMHRVHHSVTIRETNSNFGFNLPWWDRLFGTYRPQPVAGHTGMTIGLAQFRDPKRAHLGWMLALPFIGRPGNYSINRWGKEPVQKPKEPLS